MVRRIHGHKHAEHHHVGECNPFCRSGVSAHEHLRTRGVRREPVVDDDDRSYGPHYKAQQRAEEEREWGGRA